MVFPHLPDWHASCQEFVLHAEDHNLSAFFSCLDPQFGSSVSPASAAGTMADWFLLREQGWVAECSLGIQAPDRQDWCYQEALTSLLWLWELSQVTRDQKMSDQT